MIVFGVCIPVFSTVFLESLLQLWKSIFLCFTPLVSVSLSVSLIVSDSQFCCLLSSFSAVKIEGLGAVAAIACGQEHSLALCDSGQVFSWGAGGDGQLGHRRPVAKCLKPL